MSTPFKHLLFLLASILFLPIIALAQGPKNALQLDGYNDNAELGTNNRGITDQVTVEVWIKTNSTGHHHVVSKYDRDSENGFQLLIQNGRAGFAGRDDSGNYRFSGHSNTIVADNNWHHLAGVTHNGTWMIYVDGQLEKQLVTGYKNTVLTNSERLLLGNYYYAQLGSHYYPGVMDEVKIWNKALTAEEIRQNMCRTVSSNTSNLVGYFKLDNISGGTVIDDSSLKLNGKLTNTTPGVASVVSGAPIGDISVYRYTDGEAAPWAASLEMVTNRANFAVANVDPTVEGFHLYSIQTKPAATSGIGDPQEVQEYYGLFKIGGPSKKYKVNLTQIDMSCGGKLYRRQNNTDNSWDMVADTTASPVIRYISSANYGEFAATGKAGSTATISGPENICPGTTSTLSVAAKSDETVVWSTGATAASIKVTEGGTYWADVTSASGCTVRDEIIVAVAQEPTFSFETTIPFCNNEPAVLDVTTAGATYKWSNGQTTPTISVSTTGTYSVTISHNGCSYVKEIVVSDNECPIIPNIITPNGDNKNDAFVVQGVEANTMAITVFNRWGKVVYKSSQYGNDWAAINLPNGTYFYQLKSSRSNRVYKGWVEVMK